MTDLEFLGVKDEAVAREAVALVRQMQTAAGSYRALLKAHGVFRSAVDDLLTLDELDRLVVQERDGERFTDEGEHYLTTSPDEALVLAMRVGRQPTYGGGGEQYLWDGFTDEFNDLFGDALSLVKPFDEDDDDEEVSP